MAADELHDGPFCVLLLVDNHTFKRIAYQVLDHAATQEDVLAFLHRFQRALQARGLELRGVTTDASPLYAGPIAEVFPGVMHQICQFHVLWDLTRCVRGAVAKLRKQLVTKAPQIPRGRPASAERHRDVRRKKRLMEKVRALFDHRTLFVKRKLTGSERRTLGRITRWHPLLSRLRQIMEQVYQLFDRRCGSVAARAKLAKLRQKVRRFPRLTSALGKLFSRNLDKALVFLDDRLLPATSNSVERGNRRYRKMQNSVYRVRVHDQLQGRLALDLLRETRAQSRQLTLHTLHQARAA